METQSPLLVQVSRGRGMVTSARMVGPGSHGGAGKGGAGVHAIWSHKRINAYNGHPEE